MVIRILCTGDVHLGRRPTLTPETTDTHFLKPASAWHSFVDAAIERKVDSVALTGDIVDESNKFYEAFSALQSGIERLVSAEIPVVAVAGNHDFDILPRLADQIQGFSLLGRGGHWEEFVVERNGKPVVRFYGWSFPGRHVSQSPLAECTAFADDLPTIGLLHCDCDVPTSIYGPVSLKELKGKALTAWLLGHIHNPTILADSFPLILYPGSLQGLDAGEPGPHGAWLITLGPESVASVEHIPLAGLRWERIGVSLDTVSDEDSFQRAVTDALREKHENIRRDLGQTRVVGCRLYFTGRTPLHRWLPQLASSIQLDLIPRFDGVEYFIEKTENLTSPDILLEEIGKSNDPAGLLARHLIMLEQREPPDAYQELLERAKQTIGKIHSRTEFAPLIEVGQGLKENQVRDLLVKAGLRLLDELLAQKEVNK
jgi:predicted phosphodiesterase